MSDNHLKLHDVVALMEPIPNHGLRRGQIGTIIDVYEPGVYEVEFADTSGQTYASLTLRTRQLLPLYQEPASAKRSA
jgi:hypothetical protein